MDALQDAEEEEGNRSQAEEEGKVKLLLVIAVAFFLGAASWDAWQSHRARGHAPTDWVTVSPSDPYAEFQKPAGKPWENYAPRSGTYSASDIVPSEAELTEIRARLSAIEARLAAK